MLNSNQSNANPNFKIPHLKNNLSRIITVNELEKTKRFFNCKEPYQVFNNIGIVYSDNNLGKAEENYVKSLTLNPNSNYTKFNLANIYLKQNRNELAISTYSTLLNNENFNQDLINFYLAIANENLGQIDAALEYYQNSNLFQSAYNASLIYQKRNNLSSALLEAKRSIRINNQSEKALYNYSTLLYKKGDLVNAIKQLKKSIKLSPDNYKKQQLAYLYFFNNNFSQARDTFNELIDDIYDVSYKLTGKIGLARISLEEGKYFECITLLKEVLKQAPNNAIANKTIADAYINVRNYSKADGHYKAAFNNGLKTEATTGLAVSMHKQGDFEGAKAFYSTLNSVELSNLSYDTYLIFAVNEYQLGYITEALELTSKAISMDNKRPEAYSFLAKLQYQTFEFNKAEDNYKQAIKLADNKEVYMVNLANCYVYTFNYKKALKQFENAIIQNPEYSKAYTGLGMCLLKLNRHQEALLAIDKAIETDPNDPFNHANKSYALARIASELTNEIKKEEYLIAAMDEIIIAKNMDESYMKIHYDNNIGLLFMEMEQHDSALVYLTKVTNEVTLNNEGVLLKREGDKITAETKFNQSIAFNRSEGREEYLEPVLNLEKLHSKGKTKSIFRKKDEIVEWITYWIFLRNDIIELREHNFTKVKYNPEYMSPREIEYRYHAFLSKSKKTEKIEDEKVKKEEFKINNNNVSICPYF